MAGIWFGADSGFCVGLGVALMRVARHERSLDREQQATLFSLLTGNVFKGMNLLG
jgi:hypothetical protein